jgi:hypothetical protein
VRAFVFFWAFDFSYAQALATIRAASTGVFCFILLSSVFYFFCLFVFIPILRMMVRDLRC